MTWNDTNTLLKLIEQEFVREHDKPKIDQSSEVLDSLRRAATALHYARIALNQQ